ncbi:hypothetical protein Efla_004898 [Eimeria flavescens]
MREYDREQQEMAERATIIRPLGWGPTEGDHDDYNSEQRRRRVPDSNGSDRWAGAQSITEGMWQVHLHRMRRGHLIAEILHLEIPSRAEIIVPLGILRSASPAAVKAISLRIAPAPKTRPGATATDAIDVGKDALKEPKPEPAKMEERWYYLGADDAEEEAVVLAVAGDTYEPNGDEDDKILPGQKQPQTYEEEELRVGLLSTKLATNGKKKGSERGGLAPDTADSGLERAEVDLRATAALANGETGLGKTPGTIPSIPNGSIGAAGGSSPADHWEDDSAEARGRSLPDTPREEELGKRGTPVAPSGPCPPGELKGRGGGERGDLAQGRHLDEAFHSASPPPHAPHVHGSSVEGVNRAEADADRVCVR